MPRPAPPERATPTRGRSRVGSLSVISGKTESSRQEAGGTRQEAGNETFCMHRSFCSLLTAHCSLLTAHCSLLTLCSHWIQHHNFRVFSQVVDESIDLRCDFFFRKFTFDCASRLGESWHYMTGVLLAPVKFVVISCNLFVVDQNESTKTKVYIVVNLDPFAQNLVELFAGQTDPGHSFLKDRSRAKFSGQLVGALLDFLHGRFAARQLFRFE